MTLAAAATISMMSCQTQDIPEVEIVNSVLGTRYTMINSYMVFTSDLLADDADMRNIFDKIRMQFGFNIPAENREEIITFGDLVSYVTEHSVSIPLLPSNPDIRIFEKIQEIINEKMNIPIGLICAHSNIKNDFGMDSLDFVEFIMALEEEFQIEIPDEYATRIKTVEDCWAYIESLS